MVASHKDKGEGGFRIGQMVLSANFDFEFPVAPEKVDSRERAVNHGADQFTPIHN